MPPPALGCPPLENVVPPPDAPALATPAPAVAGPPPDPAIALLDAVPPDALGDVGSVQANRENPTA